MTGIPAEIPYFARPATYEATHADIVGDNLRSVALNVTEAQQQSDAGALHGLWQGSARESADHLLTSVAARLGNAQAALLAGSLAADDFAAALGPLDLEETSLRTRRTTINAAIARLRATAEGGLPTDFGAECATLSAAATRLLDDVAVWEAALLSAEATFVAAIASVDSVGEARGVAATQPSSVEIAALAQRVRDTWARNPTVAAQEWAALTPQERAALSLAEPQLVGSIGGIPAADRDLANRASVYADADYLGLQASQGATLSAEEEARLENAEHVREVLNSYAGEVDPTTGQQAGYLLLYDPVAYEGDGGVAFSLNNPDTAEHVVTYVPGTTHSVTSLGANVGALEELHETTNASGASVATVVWIGYNAPSFEANYDDPGVTDLADGGGLISGDSASGAGGNLATFIDGLRASDSGDQAHLTVMGHSYGSTVVAEAGSQYAAADEFVLLANPGAGDAGSAADVGVAGGEVWAGSADNDPITYLGSDADGSPLGKDAASASFGANRIPIDPGTAAVADLGANHDLGHYLSGSGFDAVAEIITGGDPATVEGRDGDSTGLEALLESLAETTAQRD